MTHTKEVSPSEILTPHWRSQALEPFPPSGQRYRKKAWGGNILEPGEWITDGHLMVHRHVISDLKLLDMFMTPHSFRHGITQELARSLLHGNAVESWYPVEILGVLPGVRIGGNTLVAYLLCYTDEEMALRYVDADLLNFFVRGVMWETMTAGPQDHPVIFRRHGEPVGLLMQLNLSDERAQQTWGIDIPTAIEHLRSTTRNSLVGPSVHTTREEVLWPNGSRCP